MLVDSHCHLDYIASAVDGMNVEDILRRAHEAGVGRMLTVAVDRANLGAVLAHAREHEPVFAAVGIHPSSCADDVISVDDLVELAGAPKVVAIGETGLDYHYRPETAEIQQRSFVNHLKAASRARLPVIVHTRDASQDTLRLLAAHSDPGHGGVMHCFTESLAVARAAMELNFLVSFSGIITFRSAGALREVVREVPLERMLVETDAPYLSPVPHRGRTNEPGHVVHVAEMVAAIKQTSVDEVAAVTTENFFRLFPRAAA